MKTTSSLVASRRLLVSVVLCAAALLTACGGGGGAAPNLPTPPAGGKAWQASSQIIDQLGSNASDAQVTINAEGVGFAAWIQADGNGLVNVLGSRYSAGVWEPAQSISQVTSGLFAITEARIAVHPNGEATAIWIQTDESDQTSLVVNRFVANQWAKPNALVAASGTFRSPQIASSANGSAMVVWLQQELGDRRRTWATFFNGTAFSLPFNLDIGNGDTFAPQVAMNSKGEAVAVWEKNLANVTRIEARSFANGNWFFSTDTLSNTAIDANSPQVALGDNGQATALWVQQAGAVPSLFASRRDAANKWATPELLETDDAGRVFQPDLSMDALGNATAVWEQQDASTPGLRKDGWANRFSDDKWQGAQKLELNDAGEARVLSVGSDSAGNAIAVWEQLDGTRFDIFSARFNGSQWSAPELIERDNAGNAQLAQLAVNPSGRALAVWQQRTGPINDPASTVNIVANVFK
jgi:hypothetical protein